MTTGTRHPHPVLALEAVMAQGWPALEVEPLGAWLLRAAGGFTGRGNSALPLGDPGLPLPEAVDAVEAFYARRGLAAQVAVPRALAGPVREEGLDGGALDALLAGRGWSVHTETAVMTAPLGALPTSAPLPGGAEVVVTTDPDADWQALYRYRGQQLPPQGLAVLTGPPVRAFAAVRSGSRTLAVARGTTTPDGPRAWLGVTAVEVHPDARRRGLGRALLAALARWGAEVGATDAHLQVTWDNTAARALYASAGFTDHHGYAYRRAAPRA